MQHFDFRNMMEIHGAILPLAVLMLEDDQDRDFMTDVYIRYKPLMYKVAMRYFANRPQDAEEAMSDAVENMCRYIKNVRGVPEEHLPKYIVCIVRNACNYLLRKRNAFRRPQEEAVDFQSLETTADESALHEVILSRETALEILHAFPSLSQRDRELIRLRHIDLLEYEEIAEVLGISVATARTALHRAKRRLEKIARENAENWEG